MKKAIDFKKLEFGSHVINGHYYIGLNEVKKTKQLMLENNKEISDIMRKELYEKIVIGLNEILNNENNNAILLSYFYQIKGKLLLLRYTDFNINSKLIIYKECLEFLNFLVCNFDGNINLKKIKHILQLFLKLNNFQQF